MEKNIKLLRIKNMYIPTPDDEVQITRKMYGMDCFFQIKKKIKLSFLDRLKKLFKIADEWIDYEYAYSYIYSESDSELKDYQMNPSYRNLKFIEDKYNMESVLWDTVKSLSRDFIGDEFTIYGVIFGKNAHKIYNYDMDTIEFSGTDVFVSKNLESPDAAKLIFDNLLKLPHVEILHTGEWNEELQNSFIYDNYIETTEKRIPHPGVVVKHVSGDREKVVTIYNPDFKLWIKRP
jgi:hypothetical protein